MLALEGELLSFPCKYIGSFFLFFFNIGVCLLKLLLELDIVMSNIRMAALMTGTISWLCC